MRMNQRRFSFRVSCLVLRNKKNIAYWETICAPDVLKQGASPVPLFVLRVWWAWVLKLGFGSFGVRVMFWGDWQIWEKNLK